MPKVYVPNKSYHDFSAAESYGRLVYLTEGIIRPNTSINQLYRMIAPRIAGSDPDDMLLISSLSILNAIAASLLAQRHGCINYLIYHRGSYNHSRIVLPPNKEEKQDDTGNSQLPDAGGD